MKRIHIFFINVFILTLTSSVIQSIILWFNGYLTKIIGTEGIGLYHLLMSVYGISVTFATSGINLAVTRLIAENNEKPGDVMKSSILYNLFFSIISTIVLFKFSKFIATSVLNDIRTVKAIKIMAFSMPLVAITSTFNGYFTAKKQVIKTSTAQFSETIIKIITTIIFIKLLKNKTPENFCYILVLGNLSGEIISFIILLLFYKKQQLNKCSGLVINKILNISAPVAISSIIRSGLNSYKQIIVPLNLKKSGLTHENALSSYGKINGIVMPVLAMPMSILYSCSNMLIPEIASCNNIKQIKRIVKKALLTTTAFAIIAFVVCLFFHNKICEIIYGSSQCGKYVLIMSPIILTMYIDAVCDGLLKALNQQIYSMKLNIIDTFMCILLIPVLVGKFGIYGYITVIYISEIFNTSLSLKKLKDIINKNSL